MCPRWLNKILNGVHPESPASNSPWIEPSQRAEAIASPQLHSCHEQDQTRGELAFFLPLFVVIVVRRCKQFPPF